MHSSMDIDAVLAAFRTLGIPPTADGNAIRKAFRTAAMKFHPDRVQGDDAKASAQAEFNRLARARDLVLEAFQAGLLDDVLRHGTGRAASGGTATPRTPTPSATRARAATPPERPAEAYEDEWKVFVADENAYFRLFDSASATLAVLAMTFMVTMWVSLYLSVLAVLFLLIMLVGGVLLLAVLSASIALPVLGWIFGIGVLMHLGAGVIKLGNAVEKAVDDAASNMLRTVARTGYPTANFYMAIGASMALLVGAIPVASRLGAGVLTWPVVVLGLVMGGSMSLIWSKIGAKLAELDAAFARIRNTVSYALVVGGRKAS